MVSNRVGSNKHSKFVWKLLTSRLSCPFEFNTRCNGSLFQGKSLTEILISKANHVVGISRPLFWHNHRERFSVIPRTFTSELYCN